MMIDDETYALLRDWTKTYIKTNCIIRSEVPMKNRMGDKQSWILYVRNALFDHTFMSCMSLMFLYKVEREIDKDIDFQICGLDNDALPILIGIPLVAKAYDIDINAFSIRDQKQGYGIDNIIEGRPTNQKILMINDIANGSNTLALCKNFLDKNNVEVLPYAFSIVNEAAKYEKNKLYRDQYLGSKFKLISLFDLGDIDLG